MTITEEQVKAWTHALRSGNYTQGVRSLHDEARDTWCCLGVLCDVVGIPTMELKDPPNENYEGIRELLGGSVFDRRDDIMQTLWEMNDGTSCLEPESFPEIADWIDEHIKPQS